MTLDHACTDRQTDRQEPVGALNLSVCACMDSVCAAPVPVPVGDLRPRGGISTCVGQYMTELPTHIQRHPTCCVHPRVECSQRTVSYCSIVSTIFWYLYCASLYCTVLYRAVLYYAYVLYCIVWSDET